MNLRPQSYSAIVAALIAIAAVAAWYGFAARRDIVVDNELPAPCRDMTFENAVYVVCQIDLNRQTVGIYSVGPDGKPYGSLERLSRDFEKTGKPVALAMNAGMYHEDLSPVGLLVESGRIAAPLNIGDGEGNFYLKPNGVFLIRKDGEGAILETSAYAAEGPDVAFATQSGPMLVIDGQIHPQFGANGASHYRRNGIGMGDSRTIWLAISRSEVSFGAFARLFRDGLGCRNALYFDGVVSALLGDSKMIIGGDYPAGPILAVSAKR